MAETAELKKFEEEKQRALQQKEIQMKQLDDMRTKIISERREERREGQLIRARALQEEEEMRQKEVSRYLKFFKCSGRVWRVLHWRFQWVLSEKFINTHIFVGKLKLESLMSPSQLPT